MWRVWAAGMVLLAVETAAAQQSVDDQWLRLLEARVAANYVFASEADFVETQHGVTRHGHATFARNGVRLEYESGSWRRILYGSKMRITFILTRWTFDVDSTSTPWEPLLVMTGNGTPHFIGASFDGVEYHVGYSPLARLTIDGRTQRITQVHAADFEMTFSHLHLLKGMVAEPWVEAALF